MRKREGITALKSEQSKRPSRQTSKSLDGTIGRDSRRVGGMCREFKSTRLRYSTNARISDSGMMCKDSVRLKRGVEPDVKAFGGIGGCTTLDVPGEENNEEASETDLGMFEE